MICSTCIRSPLTFKSAYVELGTMEVEHELMVTMVVATVVVATVVVATVVVVTVVVATMHGDVVSIGADDACELLGVAKSKSIS